MSPSRAPLPSATRRHRPHRTAAGALLLGTALLVGACGANSADQASVAPAPMPPGIAAPGGPAMAGGTPMDGGAAMGAEAMTKDAGTDRSIVRTSTITVRVDALDAAAEQWRATVAGLGGIVSDEYAGDDGTTPYATITAKVPASRLDEAIAAARGLGQPLSVSTSASQPCTAPAKQAGPTQRCSSPAWGSSA